MFSTKKRGERIITEETVYVGNQPVQIAASSELTGNPLRGYKKICVFKDEEVILEYEKGGGILGYGYEKGNNCLIEKETAYLLSDAKNMSRSVYSDDGSDITLLVFNRVVVPDVYSSKITATPTDATITKDQAERFRTIDWQGIIQTEGGQFKICNSSIKGYKETFSMRYGVPYESKPGSHHEREEIIGSDGSFSTHELKYYLSHRLE